MFANILGHLGRGLGGIGVVLSAAESEWRGWWWWRGLWSSPHFHILSLTSISLLDRLEGEFRQHFSVAFAQQDYRWALLGGCGGIWRYRRNLFPSVEGSSCEGSNICVWKRGRVAGIPCFVGDLPKNPSELAESAVLSDRYLWGDV